ncbi:unnamed protein product [Clonostachys solani]|uniref:Uncharacterized protein n=1 Tax=Clonostachys solani TaxID=160281 RepID=A0A9N9YVQ1_9HYPO|nr:unnamed protein product [Clonostachys solani]
MGRSSTSATNQPHAATVSPGSAEFVALQLGPRALGCNHLPKYQPSLEGNNQKYPALLGFFHQSQSRHSQVCVSILETCKLCVNCLSQATPDGYVFWSSIAKACSHDASSRKKDEWLAGPASSVNYPPFFQAGMEGFSGLSSGAISSTPRAQPSIVAIPKLPGAEQAWGWIDAQRKPFYIDQLHLAAAERDVTIVQKFGVPFTGEGKSKAPKPKSSHGSDATAPLPTGPSHLFARPPGPAMPPHGRSASTPGHLQQEVKPSHYPKPTTDPSTHSSTTQSVSSSGFLDGLLIYLPQPGSSFLPQSQPTNPTATPSGPPVGSKYPSSLPPGLPKTKEVKRKPVKACLPDASDKTSASSVVPGSLEAQKSAPITSQPVTSIEKAIAPAKNPKNVPARDRSNTPSLFFPGQEPSSQRQLASKDMAAGTSSRTVVSTTSAGSASMSRALTPTHSTSITHPCTSDVKADHGVLPANPGHFRTLAVGSSNTLSTVESHGSAAAKAKPPTQFTTSQSHQDLVFLNKATAPQLPKKDLPTAGATTSNWSLHDPLFFNEPVSAPAYAPYTRRAANLPENESGRLDLKLSRGQDSHVVGQVPIDRSFESHKINSAAGTAPVRQPRFVPEETVKRGDLEVGKMHQVKPVYSGFEATKQQASQQTFHQTVNQTVQQSSQQIFNGAMQAGSRTQAKPNSAVEAAKNQPLVQQQQAPTMGGSQWMIAAGFLGLGSKTQKVGQKSSQPDFQQIHSDDKRALDVGIQRQMNTSSSGPGAKSKQSVQHTMQSLSQENYNQSAHQNNPQNFQQQNFQQQNYYQPFTQTIQQDLPQPSKQASRGPPSAEVRKQGVNKVLKGLPNTLASGIYSSFPHRVPGRKSSRLPKSLSRSLLRSIPSGVTGQFPNTLLNNLPAKSTPRIPGKFPME